jgi:hypothetical protein
MKSAGISIFLSPSARITLYGRMNVPSSTVSILPI